MDKQEIVSFFEHIIIYQKDVSSGMAAILTLFEVLKNDKAETMQELLSNLQAAIDVMKNTDYPVTSITSGCELFLRFITLAKLDTKTIEECKEIMLHLGEKFLKNLREARGKIAKLACDFIKDGSKILTHSKSRVVLQTMKTAAKANKNFEVYVTNSSPDNSGLEMSKELKELNIQCTNISDSRVGSIMEQVDMVMVGAEGVVENGGCINKIGTFTMAMCAKIMNKPFYLLTESFKFVRLFPLNQSDLPDEFKYPSSLIRKGDLKNEHPLVDYTPPAYITLLFTDIGIFPPAAVSDQLIKLYL